MKSSAFRPSSPAIILTASARDLPQIISSGANAPQMRGRSGLPNIRHRMSSSRLTQRTPAGLPSGIPGSGELIDITVQQTAQCGLHSICFFSAIIRENRHAENANNKNVYFAEIGPGKKNAANIVCGVLKSIGPIPLPCVRPHKP